MSQPRIVMFGDSHVDAVKRAIKLRRMARKDSGIEAFRLSKIKNDKIVGDIDFEEAIKLIGTLTKDDAVISLIGGNQHAVLSTVQHPKPFKVYGPAEEATIISRGEQIIPSRAVRSFLQSGVSGRDGALIKELKSATPARVFHIIPPPPKENNDHIKRHHETHFSDLDIVSLGVSPPDLRYKIWALQADVLKQLCSEWDVEIVSPPSLALTHTGFLDPAYYANDATHANSDYGELILQTIETVVQTKSGKRVN
ncbi:hypothetical protein [Sphingobium phenoxybenzoativorans]|uniref:hypothetical protein n=1 Tax=Sphingobium phenoxybenzoativorans TaxID=1592790 RepID=UPI000871C6FD|nr:hypothetical protein [Sphingobium phenoxybenzoativorans]